MKSTPSSSGQAISCRSVTRLVAAGATVLLLSLGAGSAETRVREFDPPVRVAEGLLIDLNEDGLADFEIDELRHEDAGLQVVSIRLVGRTHIDYPGEIGYDPVLLHARFHGIFEVFDHLPGSAGMFLTFNPNIAIYAEFARIFPDAAGGEVVRGAFDEWGRSYLGVSVETLEGSHWGWVEVKLLDGVPMLTAIGYESVVGTTSMIGGVPGTAQQALNIEREGDGFALSWAWSDSVDYRIEQSIDLKSWLPLEVPIESDGAEGRVKFIPPGGGESTKFFRLFTSRPRS